MAVAAKHFPGYNGLMNESPNGRTSLEVPTDSSTVMDVIRDAHQRRQRLASALFEVVFAGLARAATATTTSPVP